MEVGDKDDLNLIRRGCARLLSTSLPTTKGKSSRAILQVYSLCFYFLHWRGWREMSALL